MPSEFDDPFAPSEGTMLRPRPGGRRVAVEPRVDSARAATALPSNALPVAQFLSGSQNPILQAATPLLTIGSRLQWSVAHTDVHALRAQAVQEVRNFDDRMRASRVSADDAVVARYVLCTFFDSAVLNTPWGAQSDWSGQSLLLTFHKERAGGEKFFQILERMQGQPSRYIDLLELQYACLALGYEGMYRLQDRGRTQLIDIQSRLSRLIRDARERPASALSAHWEGVEDRRNPVLRYVPWWTAAAAAAAILIGVFVFYTVRLNAQAAPIKQALLTPAQPPVQYTEPVTRVTRLKELLASQEAAGALTVEDFGSMSVVTLIANGLFRSGSAQLNPAYQETLVAVATALNQVPGQVVIVGHTDDQPVRSLRFADNFELSRERAVSVATMMKPTLTNFGRVEWLGLGSTQPRYKPVDTSENRARNRRVEIVNKQEEGR